LNPPERGTTGVPAIIPNQEEINMNEIQTRAPWVAEGETVPPSVETRDETILRSPEVEKLLTEAERREIGRRRQEELTRLGALAGKD
jgi:hypothetical protein